MKSTTQRICPNCGATNTGRSLFCAECGADLNKPPDAGATRPFEPATTEQTADSSQPTEAYKPLWDQTWSGTGEHDDTVASPPATQQSQPVPAAAPAPILAAPRTNPRSFWLGLIALLIIIAIAIALGVLSLI